MSFTPTSSKPSHSPTSRRPSSVTLALIAGLVVACSESGAESVEDVAESGDQSAPVSDAGGSGVILVYHHIDTATPEMTSVTPERYREHLDHLEEHDFNVWPLPRLLEAAQQDEPIPDKTVAITFDDAYQSVYDEVFPLMQERDLPFTVFVPTDPIGGLDIYLDWDELREMEAAGVTLANHGVNHAHMAHPRQGESRDEWLARMEHEIVTAQDELEAELDDPARIFAWPYGESSPDVEELLLDLDFLGVGQHSGAVAAYSHNFASLPRFPMTTGFDDLESFALKVRTRPLPVRRTEPVSGVLPPDAEYPEIRLTLDAGDYRQGQLSCYARGRALDTEIIDNDSLVVRARATDPVPVGRTPFNCTAPSASDNRWYWFSFLWMKPQEHGRWYTW